MGRRTAGELDRLLAGVAAGDRDALARLYRLTRTAVWRPGPVPCKNPQDAQDIAQDAFVRIWDSAPQYQSQGSPMGWILTVTRNLALMKLRSRGREAGLEEEQWLAIPAGRPQRVPRGPGSAGAGFGHSGGSRPGGSCSSTPSPG